MKNKAKTIAGITAVVATASISNTVNAEQVDAYSAVSEVEITTQVQEQSQQEVTAQDVATSQVKLSQANQDVASQEVVVKEANQEVESSQAEVKQTQELASQATPENIAKQEQDVQDKTTNVTNAEKAVTDAKAKEDQAAQNVTNQEQVVSEVKSEVSAAQDEVNTAQKDVDTAQAILDGTNQTSVIKEANDAKANLEKATSALKDAQAKLDAAKQADTTRANNISILEKELETAKKVQADAQTQVDAATKAHDSAQTALTDANNKFTKAENDYKAINTIKLNSEYIEALKKYAHNGGDSAVTKEASDTLASLYDWGQKNNTFKSNPNDTTTTYDINNLPEDKIKELSFFASDLINQIREQMGTPKTAVNDDAVKLADLTTDGYVADNWSWAQVGNIGHDAKAVNNAAKTFGLFTSSGKTEEEGVQFYENIMTTYRNVSRVTMDDAKRRVYNAIVGFMFNRYEWMHAESIAGETIDDGSTITYIGVDLSSRDDATGVHVLDVNSGDAKGTTFSTQQLANPRSAEALTKAYNDAKTVKTNAEAKELSTRNAITQAKSSRASADQNVKTVTTNLTKVKAVPVQTPAAQAKFDVANTSLISATERNNKAQEALNSLSADMKTKQANLENAKANLKAKETDLATKQATLASEQAKLNTLTQALTEANKGVETAKSALVKAQSDLAQAKQYVADLKNAPSLLAKAQEKLQEAQTALKKAQADLETLTAYRDELQVKHDELVATYNKQEEAKEQARLKAQYDAIVQSGGLPVPVVNANGKVIAYHNDKKLSFTAVSTSEIGKEEYGVEDLPETGDSYNYLAVLGAGILTSLSLLSFQKRKED